MKPTPLHILLVANYLPDGQESMQRFSSLLERELPGLGLEVSLIRPEPRFRRLAPSGQLAKWLGYLDKLVWFPRRLAWRVRRNPRPHVTHVCDHSNAIYTPALAGVPHLVTCHDLLAIRSGAGLIAENRTEWSGRMYQRLILRGLNRSGRVACVSEATRMDLLEMTTLDRSQTEVIYNGLNYAFSPMEHSAAVGRILALCPALAAEAGAGPYLLHVGGNQWYKNRLGLLKIYYRLTRLNAALPPLVMVGKPFPAELRNFVAQHGLGRRVIEINQCGSEDLRALYSLAQLFIFPSLQEGFGWPIIEAQACGCLVATTDRAPMTEIGGPEALYFNPKDPFEAASKIMLLLAEGPARLERRRQQGLANAGRFTTRQMLDGYARAYAGLAGIEKGENRAAAPS